MSSRLRRPCRTCCGTTRSNPKPKTHHLLQLLRLDELQNQWQLRMLGSLRILHRPRHRLMRPQYHAAQSQRQGQRRVKGQDLQHKPTTMQEASGSRPHTNQGKMQIEARQRRIPQRQLHQENLALGHLVEEVPRLPLQRASLRPSPSGVRAALRRRARSHLGLDLEHQVHQLRRRQHRKRRIAFLLT